MLEKLTINDFPDKLPRVDHLDRSEYGELTQQEIKEVSEYVLDTLEHYSRQREENNLRQRKTKAKPERYIQFYDEAQRLILNSSSTNSPELTQAKRFLLEKHFPRFGYHGKQPIFDYPQEKINTVFSRVFRTAEMACQGYTN